MLKNWKQSLWSQEEGQDADFHHSYSQLYWKSQPEWKARKRNKSHQIWKERSKTVTICGWHVFKKYLIDWWLLYNIGLISFLIFIFTLFCFTILYWFWHTLTWICHRCTWAPKHEPPSHLPPHIIPPDHPCAPAPSILHSALNIDWWFVSYKIVYMFQCHSPKSSHPLPLPQSPKVRSTHLCLFCYLACRVIITIFLNSIYMC